MRDFITENIFKEIKAQITRPRHQDNIQRDANRLAWDYKDYISELSEEKEQNTRVFCNILHIDIKRYLKDSNLGIYDLTYENYSFERAPMLVWLGN